MEWKEGLQVIKDIYHFIVANFFYDWHSAVVSVSFVLSCYFLYKLLKDKGDKINVSVKYLSAVIICFGTFIYVM